MSSIPNDELSLEQVPSSEGDLRGWIRFAHSINGYEVMGGFDSCADLANSSGAATLTQLRCALFFEARRDRHTGGLSNNEELIRDLLRAIRHKVKSRELD